MRGPFGAARPDGDTVKAPSGTNRPEVHTHSQALEERRGVGAGLGVWVGRAVRAALSYYGIWEAFGSGVNKAIAKKAHLHPCNQRPLEPLEPRPRCLAPRDSRAHDIRHITLVHTDQQGGLGGTHLILQSSAMRAFKALA